MKISNKITRLTLSLSLFILVFFPRAKKKEKKKKQINLFECRCNMKSVYLRRGKDDRLSNEMSV